MIKGLGMSEPRPCMRKTHNGNGHRPDLTGMEYPYLTVISPGGFKYPSKKYSLNKGSKYFLWIVRHKLSGKVGKVYAHDLVNGRTGGLRSAGGSGVFNGKKVPEYATVIQHYSKIFNSNAVGHEYYKGMPFYSDWDSRKEGSPIRGYLWIIKNLGHKPGSKWSLDIIQHSKGFVPGNLRWVPPSSSLQSKNQVHRTIFDVTDKVFAVEAKRRGYRRI